MEVNETGTPWSWWSTPAIERWRPAVVVLTSDETGMLVLGKQRTVALARASASSTDRRATNAPRLGGRIRHVQLHRRAARQRTDRYLRGLERVRQRPAAVRLRRAVITARGKPLPVVPRIAVSSVCVIER